MVSMKLWTTAARLRRSSRSWMAHHQGMSLLAICNLLFNDPMQEYFHAEPQVLATELLLHERVPNAISIEKEAIAPPPLVAEAAA